MTYITTTGMQYHFGIDAFKIGQKVYLEKDIENEYDSEAVRVMSECGNKLGHVANSVRTVAKGTHSAGWIGHMLTEKMQAKILFITGHSVIAEIVKDDKQEN